MKQFLQAWQDERRQRETQGLLKKRWGVTTVTVLNWSLYLVLKTQSVPQLRLNKLRLNLLPGTDPIDSFSVRSEVRGVVRAAMMTVNQQWHRECLVTESVSGAPRPVQRIAHTSTHGKFHNKSNKSKYLHIKGNIPLILMVQAWQSNIVITFQYCKLL